MKKLIAILLTAALLVSALAGCGSSSSDSSASSATNTSAETKTDTSSDNQASDAADTADGSVTTILVGTSGNPKPFLYTDDDNNVIGYDADVVAAIDELLPQYEFVYELTDFPAVFTGVDAGIYQMGDGNITKTAEREEKYLFGDEYYGYNYTGLVVRIDDDSFTSLDDLAGKSTFTSSSGGFGQIFFETYNEKHADNPAELIYTSADQRKQFQDLEAGVVDFIFMESVMFDSYLEEFPEYADTLKFVRLSDEDTKQIQDPLAWFIFPKTDEGEVLKEAVDGALRQLKEDGTLNELGQKWLGYDVVR